MKDEDREEIGELVGLLESLISSGSISESCLLDLNYRLRKKLEQLLCEVDNREHALGIYYLLGDNYAVIRRDPAEGMNNLLQILPFLQTLTGNTR